MKNIYFIRHAQARHNVAYSLYGEEAYESDNFIDADLTDKGIAQANKCSISFNVIPIQVVFTSPLTRTLHTTSIIFKHHIIPIIAREDIRERFDRHPVNNRKNISTLSLSYPFIDFSHIKDDKDNLYKTKDDLTARAKSFIEYLLTRPETSIAVVSHETFLREVLTQLNSFRCNLDNCEFINVIL